MSDRGQTRRSVLRGAGAAVGAGALASIAGCMDSIPGVGSGGQYSQWLPEPGEIGDQDHYSFTYFDTAVLADNEDELADDTVDSVESIEQFWDPVDVDWDETSWFLYGTHVVVAADYELEDVVDDLEDDDYEEESEYEGYQIFEKEGRGVAVGNGMIASTGLFDVSEDPADDLEELIDVSNGEEDRYVEEEADMGALVDELGGGTFVTGQTLAEPDRENPAAGAFDDMVAKGNVTSVDGEVADQKYVVVYDNERDVDLDDPEEWVEANDSRDEEFDDLDDVEYSQNGRLGLVTGTIDTDDI